MILGEVYVVLVPVRYFILAGTPKPGHYVETRDREIVAINGVPSQAASGFAGMDFEID
jgi:hypothetical protein